jgi:hypothetical protein
MQKKFRVKLDGDNAGKMETASFAVPFDPAEVWGKARTPVTVTINGYTWRSTVANMCGRRFIVVNAEARAGAGVKAGDTVTVTMEPDTAPRVMEVPPELKKALGVKLTATLTKLAYTHQKEYVKWYSEAKKDETRQRRAEKMKAMLASGKTIS